MSEMTTSGNKAAAAPQPQPTAEKVSVSREQIARYAYRLYEERGGEHGHDLDDWLAAERALTAENVPMATTRRSTS
jgi:hypothetical protein